MDSRFANCPACHLSIPAEHAATDECPRCRKRDGARVPMFGSSLPYRLLAGPIFHGTGHAARAGERERDEAA
jgi:hypothetical protein